MMITIESRRWKRRWPEHLKWESFRELLGGAFRRHQAIPILCVLFFSAVSPAQQQPAEHAAADELAVLARSFTSEKLWIWQKRLNLSDWNISVTLSRASDLKPFTLGHIRWEPDTRTAGIQVLDPADYHLPQAEMLRDMEFTVVHELIHLSFGRVLSNVRRSEANRREEEKAINDMADALLTLDRNKSVKAVK